jgi:hypothetical protein
VILLLQKPIVVDVIRQPSVTPGITITDVIVGALGIAGVIMLLAALAGGLAGAAIIYAKRRAEAHRDPHETGHARLRI